MTDDTKVELVEQGKDLEALEESFLDCRSEGRRGRDNQTKWMVRMEKKLDSWVPAHWVWIMKIEFGVIGALATALVSVLISKGSL